LNKPIIDHDCEFSYQAVRHYFHNTDEIETAIGIKDAFLRLQSTPAKILEYVLIELFGEKGVIKEKTWNWLVNYKSDRHMYVDFYVPSINLAFEYDGQQHFSECAFFKIDSVALSEYQYRDSLKNKLLNDHKIGLIRLNYADSIDTENIRKRIQQITNL